MIIVINKKHKAIEIILCTHLKKIKVCALIFAFFKKFIDWKIIEKPLSEISPDEKMTEIGSQNWERFLTPLVTSKIP